MIFQKMTKMKKVTYIAILILSLFSVSAFAEVNEQNLSTMDLIVESEKNESDYVTRAEFAAIIVRGFGINETENAIYFSDMHNHWAYDYAQKVSAAGIAQGLENGKFAPEQPVTFNQAIKMLVSAVGYVPTDNKYPETFIKIAEENSILEGIDTEERILSREDAAKLVMNALNLYEVTYDDKGQEKLSFEKYIRRLGFTVVDAKVKPVKKVEMSLWEDCEMPYEMDGLEEEQTPMITAYLVENESKKNGAVVFFPGGGYHHMSQIESAQIPEFFNSCGLSVFVVEYRVAPYTYKAILSDAFRAMRVIRYNADEFNIDSTKIGIAGCSAGGHLASCVSTLFGNAEKYIGDEIDQISARPDFAVLGYPVITMKDGYTHKGSRTNFLGSETPSEELINKFSNELNVTESTPPSFVFVTEFDGSVNSMNSIDYIRALCEKKVPCELHLYPEGSHGYAVAFGKERSNEWTFSCKDWLKSVGVTD